MKEYQIVRIPILPFGLVNAYLVVSNGSCILVDSGLPGTEKKIEKQLHRLGLKFSDIKLIVVTHAHVDHAGNAALIKKLSGAPIVAHKGDLKFFLREEIMQFCDTGWFGKVFLKTGLMHEDYKSFRPDILINENQKLYLQEFGFEGVVRSTPGHTAGSLSVELSGNVALVGDLLASGILLGGIALNHIPKRPPFEDDPVLVAKQLEGLIQSGSKIFYMGHGGPLPAHTVKKHAESLLKIKS